ncbi:MAG: Nif3-like dinuclear metal center hexameric protein [Acidobacteriota bacterium]|nr:Nif3-like dinuclear metal center hexameric protein [Acidobacteriota bacterium]
MIDRERLVSILNDHLEVDGCPDLAPNGLQFEGRAEIRRVALGVTASVAFLAKAVAREADAAIVHHGLFWRSAGELRIERSLKARLAILFESDLNLLAYHIPLDRHLGLGNNAVLARALGACRVEHAFPVEGVDVGVVARLEEPAPAGEMFQRIARTVGRDPHVVAGGPETVSTFGVVTGAAPKLLDHALAAGLDMFVTGEANEQSTHLAREEGIHFVAAGHHATERFGVRALGDFLGKKFDLETIFIDDSNPV